MKNKNILVLGTGAWGTALASVLVANHHNVKMYGTNPNEIDALKHGKNPLLIDTQEIGFVPAEVSNNLVHLMQDIEYIVFAIPTQAYDEVVALLKPLMRKDITLIIASKGLEPNSGLELDIYLKQNFKDNKVSLLLGPGFAKEVINLEKTSINAISNDIKTAEEVAALFSNHNFLVIPITDNIGASICSSFKNALAILFGMIDTLKVSINTKSAILSMAMIELNHYLIKSHANQNTINELCGIGDIYLTCTSDLSRNYKFGKTIANAGSVKEAMKQYDIKTVEGYKFINTFFNTHKVQPEELVIFHTIYLLVNDKLQPTSVVDYIWEQYYEKNK